MKWELPFISEEDFTAHVSETIKKYGNKLISFDMKCFNKNIVDPIKLIFDKSVYHLSWEDTIGNELFRQRDKSNNNDIGYFHQNIFSYLSDCTVPNQGWDVICNRPGGYTLPSGDHVDTIFVEMKNKHNTMNSASSAKTYMKMQNQILKNDNCACFLVEVIAKQSQNIAWTVSVDGNKLQHRLIRQVSIDKFFELVTGCSNAFYLLCQYLPVIINKVIRESDEKLTPTDSVFEELREVAERKDVPLELAILFLGFDTYLGFERYESR